MSRSEDVGRNVELEIAISELKILNDIATTISSMQPVDQVIDQIITKCVHHLQVEEATISLLEKESAERLFMTMARRQETSANRLPIRLDDKLTGWMLKNRCALLSNNISEDERFKFFHDEDYDFQSILSVPLIVKNDLIGYLAVFNKKEAGGFGREDKRLLSIIGSQSAQVIETARLYEEEKALLSLQEEMKMAKRIQVKLLPDVEPRLDGYEIRAINIPAKSVGGDYFDFIEVEDGVTGFCVGDITGKGMPAAMLMSNLQATLRSLSTIITEPDKCLAETNKQLYRSTEDTKFATLFYGLLDHSTGSFTYTNAGHDAPILFSNYKGMRELPATGLLLGVMPESIYSVEQINLQAGELLLIYTDGITEAMDEDGQEYGLDRLKTLIRDHHHLDTLDIMEKIIYDIKSHTQKAPQSDDITLLLIKKL